MIAIDIGITPLCAECWQAMLADRVEKGELRVAVWCVNMFNCKEYNNKYWMPLRTIELEKVEGA